MDERVTRGMKKYAMWPGTVCRGVFANPELTLENFMADQQKLFLTELRLCGESNHWRVDARYTGAIKSDEGGGDSDNKQGNQQGNEEKKKSPLPEEVKLSILVPAGDRSVVDLQIDAMNRAIAFLQTTVTAARAEQAKRVDVPRE